MKTKFSSMKQAVQFAFNQVTVPSHPGAVSITLAVLSEVGVARGDVDADEVKMGVLRSYADQVLRAIREDLNPAESASLEAAFSRDWSKKRLAVAVLSSHFKTHLTRTIGNPRLIDDLVTRHYIAVRDRGHDWTIPGLGERYKCNGDRVSAAAIKINELARALEDEALANVRRILERKGVMTIEAPGPAKPDDMVAILVAHGVGVDTSTGMTISAVPVDKFAEVAQYVAKHELAGVQ